MGWPSLPERLIKRIRLTTRPSLCACKGLSIEPNLRFPGAAAVMALRMYSMGSSTLAASASSWLRMRRATSSATLPKSALTWLCRMGRESPPLRFKAAKRLRIAETPPADIVRGQQRPVRTNGDDAASTKAALALGLNGYREILAHLSKRSVKRLQLVHIGCATYGCATRLCPLTRSPTTGVPPK